MMDRRQFIAMLISALATGPAVATPAYSLHVTKTPTCGCCSAWMDRMREAGISATVHDIDQDTLGTMKETLGIASDLSRCHPAVVEYYTIEGHVPASDIMRLLSEKPTARGLAVPGMPMGSPGMHTGGATGAFDVLLVLIDGSTQVFAAHS